MMGGTTGRVQPGRKGMSKSHTVLATVLLTSLVAFTLGPWVEAAEPPDSSGAGKAGGDGAFFHIPIRVNW